MFEKEDKILVFALPVHATVNKNFRLGTVTREEPATFCDSDKKSSKPVRETASDDQQMTAFQLIEQYFRLLLLHPIEIFQRVLLGDHIIRGGRHLSKQMINDLALRLPPVALKVLWIVGGVCQHPSSRYVFRPLLSQRLFQQRIECCGDEQFEMADARQLSERLRYRERAILDDAVDSWVNLFPPVLGIVEEAANDKIQRVVLGKIV
jgi:hypothetical protein